MITRIGELRDLYATEHKDTDPRPSRFDKGGAYIAWAARADAWAAASEGYIGKSATAHYTRDNADCECGHKCVSHGSTGKPGTRVGDGECGIDRDTRNATSGYLGDMCPCKEFREQHEHDMDDSGEDDSNGRTVYTCTVEGCSETVKGSIEWKDQGK